MIYLIRFATFLAVLLVCTEAQYFYSTPVEKFWTPNNEYLPPDPTATTTPPPITTTAESYLLPNSTTAVEILIPTTTTPISTTTIEHYHHHHDELLFWDFRESIPGEPEHDYPILDKIPATKFSCDDRLDGNRPIILECISCFYGSFRSKLNPTRIIVGYYADLDTRCQVFHVCSKISDDEYIQSSFLCPNGTIFQQETFVCQW